VLLRTAAATFYQERTWPGLLAALGRRWSGAARRRWEVFAARGLPDLKAEDARATVRAAARAAAARASAPGGAAPRRR